MKRPKLPRLGSLFYSPLRRVAADDSGALLALFSIMAVVILAMTGAVVDIGLGWVSKAQLSRAVDAGVLAGARTLRNGTDAARSQALALAEANGVTSENGTALDVGFGRNDAGESTVWMTAIRNRPTFFLRAVGMDELKVGSAATAAVPPVDLVLVLDQSGSLAANGAFDDLQEASKEFLEHFDQNLDQMGLVSFQLSAAHRFIINHGFEGPIKAEIDGMVSVGDTNIGEGLRLAFAQLQLPTVRERSTKVVVFFTDGRATAFRGALGPGGPPDGGSSLGPFGSGTPGVEDRMMAVTTVTTGALVGYFDDPETLPVDALAPPDGCSGVANCWTWSEWEARDKSRRAGLEVADAIRRGGIHIYSIGLGDPGAPPMEQPDMDYLRLIANEGGASHAAQPRGRAYFAPSAGQLEDVFNQVAQDLLVRLSQ